MAIRAKAAMAMIAVCHGWSLLQPSPKMLER